MEIEKNLRCPGCNSDKSTSEIRRHLSQNKKCARKCSEEDLQKINSICDAHIKLRRAQRYQRSKSAENFHVTTSERNQKRSRSAENIDVSDNQATSLIKEDVNCDGCGEVFSIGRSIKVHLNRSDCSKAYTTESYNAIMQKCKDQRQHNRRVANYNHYVNSKEENVRKLGRFM